MAIIPKGQEPDNVKKRIEILFPKLDEAYPDKVIVSLQRDHKKWDETAREISKQLGYENKNDFLTAYGYKIEKLEGGRPSGDHMAIIDELKKRYPNGAPFEKMGELQAANPDLAGKFKTLSNRAKELFGMSLADYFKSVGLLESIDRKQQLDDLIAQLKQRYPAGSALPTTVLQLKKDNADLMVHLLNDIDQFYDCDPKGYLKRIGLIEASKYHYLQVDVKGSSHLILCATKLINFGEGDYVEMREANSETKTIGHVVKAYYDVKQEDLPCPIESMCQCIRKVSRSEMKRIEYAKPQYLYCNVIFRFGEGGSRELYYISPFEDISEGDWVMVEHSWYGVVEGYVDEVTLESRNSAPYPVHKTRQIISITKKANETAKQPIFTTENTIPFVPDNAFSEPALEFDDDMEVVNAVFRGLKADARAAAKAVGAERRRVTDEIFEFILWDVKEVMQVLQDFPSLKAVMFVENFRHSEVCTAYSRSGYPYITDSYFAGYCDFHDESRWDCKHLPTEKSFYASSLFANTGLRERVSYRFLHYKDWQAMNYVVSVDGSLRQMKEPKPEAKPEFVIEKVGGNEGVIVAYNGMVKKLVWPETYDGLTIVGVNLCKDSKKLTSLQTLVLPEGYREVGGFANCAGLKKVVLPQSLRKIYHKAFFGCKQLEEVVIQDNVYYIGDQAFAGCSELKKFTLPAQLKEGSSIGFSTRFGIDLFRNSGLRELYVNGVRSTPSYGGNCLKGNNVCKIYAPAGSPFHSDPTYQWRTVVYQLSPLLRVYNEIVPDLPRFMDAPNRCDYLQIDHNQNAIHNIRMWLSIEDVSVQDFAGKLSNRFESDCLVILDEDGKRLGFVEFSQSIINMLKTYGGRVEKFTITDKLDQNAQKNKRVACLFDIVLLATDQKETTPINPLAGKTFVVTGDLVNFPEPGPYPQRTKLRQLIENRGGFLRSAVSSKTDFLICNDVSSGSTKVKKAQELGIEIITEEEFIRRFLQ